MIHWIQSIGRSGLEYFQTLGRFGIFLLRTILRRPKIKQSFPLLVKELYSIGVLSLPIMVVSALFIGMVLSLQGYQILDKFAATVQLGQLVALSVIRELGPVVGALLFAGRAGSALTAEIGLMKATEQLSSMDMMGVDPLWRIIFPRFWAGFISLPLLTVIFSAIAIWGGVFIGVHWLGVDSGSFWSNMQDAVDFRLDVVNGIFKSITFGCVVTWIAVAQGFYCIPTAEGISRATTKTVVYASLAVLGFDFILTAFMVGDW